MFITHAWAARGVGPLGLTTVLTVDLPPDDEPWTDQFAETTPTSEES